MIESLTLRDVQRWKKLTLDLNHPVVVLAAESDRGKSTVLRALRLLCLNDFPVKDAIRHGATSLKVTARIDGHRLSRTAGKGNRMTLDGRTFKAFGTGMPAPVAELVNCRRENFSGQHDQSFWFSLTPGQVSKALNEIVNLDLIDRAMAEVAARSRRAKVEAEVAEDRLKEARAKQTELAWVEEMNEQLLLAEANYNKVIRERQACDLLTEAVQDAKQALEAVRTRENRSQALNQAVKAGEKAVKYRAEQVEPLEAAVEALQGAEADMGRFDQLAEEAERELRRRTGGTCPVCGGILK